MAKTSSPMAGGFKLFTVAGITVFLHWSWFLVAAYQVSQRDSGYSSIGWSIAEYVVLFLIVLTHEFGHALACRSVGGTADRIILWPLGGVAYVRPPMRPGAVLWSIVAGPLVNVALVPLTRGFYQFQLQHGAGDVLQFAHHIYWINIALLIFNLLPIYPLDGGKILQALLWFVIGQARSLMIASVLGIVFAIAGVGFLLWRSGGQPNVWIIVIAFFAVSQSINGFRYAQSLSKVAKLPKHGNYQCPSCRQSPPLGLMWQSTCGAKSDPFVVDGTCPACGEQLEQIRCPLCGAVTQFRDWRGAPAFPVLAPPIPQRQA